jgi:hypothetical protein
MISYATPEQWQKFYQQTGYLAYAVAAADKHITEAEVRTLKKEVTDNWLALEKTKDEFGTDAAYQIEIVFDWLAEESPSSKEAFEQFSDYVETAGPFLTDDLKMQLVDLANKIAISFHGANKAELDILFRIQKLLFK